MSLSAGMLSALQGAQALAFMAVEITLPGQTLRLLDGAGEISISGQTFVGGDPTFGVLQAVETFSDGIGNEAPAMRITIIPPTNTASATLASPTAQGGAVRVMVGAANLATGALIADPYLLFVGEIDQGVLNVGKGQRSLVLDCVSAWDRFFEDDEGVRLTHRWHQSVWPGEMGLEFVTEADRQLPWGADAPTPAVVRQSSNGGQTAIPTFPQFTGIF